MQHTRRSILAAGLTAGITGCLALGGRGSTPTAAAGPVASAPLPDAPDAFTYARAGPADAPTVTYFGNWKCPYCAQFSTGESPRPLLALGTLIEEYVVPGDLALEFRALAYGSDGTPFLGPDAPRAARAGLAVWDLAPDRYWPFHETVMAEQPPESERWATVDRLVALAEAAGVAPLDEFRTAIAGDAHRAAVRATTDAAVDAGASGTPALAAGDRTVSPFRPDRARAALDAAAEG